MAIKVSSKVSDASPKCRWSKRNIKEQKQTPSCSSAHINNAGTKPESPSHDYRMIWWVQPYSRVDLIFCRMDDVEYLINDLLCDVCDLVEFSRHVFGVKLLQEVSVMQGVDGDDLRDPALPLVPADTDTSASLRTDTNPSKRSQHAADGRRHHLGVWSSWIPSHL